MRDDDAFWAARDAAAFSDEMIQAAVHTGLVQRSGAAEQYLGDVLIKRRDKIAKTSTSRPSIPSSIRASMQMVGSTFGQRRVRGRRGEWVTSSIARLVDALRQRDGRDHAARRVAECDASDGESSRRQRQAAISKWISPSTPRPGRPGVGPSAPGSAATPPAGRSSVSNGCPTQRSRSPRLDAEPVCGHWGLR